MPHKNPMIGLMELAWKRSYGDITAFITIALGGFFTLFVLFLFSVLNYSLNFRQLINYELPQGAIDTSSVLLFAFGMGIINTVSILIFMFIIACLADYAITFVCLCYHYDNESWVTVNLIKEVNNAFTRWIKQNAGERRNRESERLAEIKAEISQIKNDNDL